jgi:cytochrome c553
LFPLLLSLLFPRWQLPRGPSNLRIAVVSRSIRARLCDSATFGRAETAIHREPASAFSQSHTRRPIFKTIHVGCRGGSQPPGGAGFCNFFAMLPAKASNDGDKELAARGSTIYQEGIPDSNIVACAPCHGPNAEGVREIPRLGGLSYYNLKTTLEQWGRGYDAAAEPPMPRVAGKLSRNEIEAIASYLSYVK